MKIVSYIRIRMLKMQKKCSSLSLVEEETAAEILQNINKSEIEQKIFQTFVCRNFA